MRRKFVLLISTAWDAERGEYWITSHCCCDEEGCWWATAAARRKRRARRTPEPKAAHPSGPKMMMLLVVTVSQWGKNSKPRNCCLKQGTRVRMHEREWSFVVSTGAIVNLYFLLQYFLTLMQSLGSQSKKKKTTKVAYLKSITEVASLNSSNCASKLY